MNNSTHTDWLDRINRALESIKGDAATQNALMRPESSRLDRSSAGRSTSSKSAA